MLSHIDNSSMTEAQQGGDRKDNDLNRQTVGKD